MHTKMRAPSYIGAEKITFPPKPDGQTDKRTDISVYRVASLLKTTLTRKGLFLCRCTEIQLSLFIFNHENNTQRRY